MNQIQRLIEDDLINNYQKHYRLAFSYVNNESDALDVVQEAAYKAVKNASKVKEAKYISTWIYRIIINESIDVIKKNKKIVPLFADVEDGLPDNYQDVDLHNAIEKLNLTDQTIIKLRFFEDLPIKEIAEILEENENTIKSRLYRTLNKLKIDLEEYENGKAN